MQFAYMVEWQVERHDDDLMASTVKCLCHEVVAIAISTKVAVARARCDKQHLHHTTLSNL